MLMILPRWQIRFTIHGVALTWVVNGDEELEALCKVLRWNEVENYTVTRETDSQQTST